VKTQDLFEEFVAITKIINQRLKIIPVLYGSLGLWHIRHHNFPVNDIDLLVPDEYIKTEWSATLSLMDSVGFTLHDAHEHEFQRGKIKIAFAGFSSLSDDLSIDPEKLKVNQISGASFKELSLEQYLSAYQYVLHDSYRKNIKNKDDQEKINFIKEQLKK